MGPQRSAICSFAWYSVSKKLCFESTTNTCIRELFTFYLLFWPSCFASNSHNKARNAALCKLTLTKLCQYRSDKILLQFQMVYSRDIKIATQIATKIDSDLHFKKRQCTCKLYFEPTGCCQFCLGWQILSPCFKLIAVLFLSFFTVSCTTSTTSKHKITCMMSTAVIVFGYNGLAFL